VFDVQGIFFMIVALNVEATQLERLDEVDDELVPWWIAPKQARENWH
jgi:hypothetical protein